MTRVAIDTNEIIGNDAVTIKYDAVPLNAQWLFDVFERNIKFLENRKIEQETLIIESPDNMQLVVDLASLIGSIDFANLILISIKTQIDQEAVNTDLKINKAIFEKQLKKEKNCETKSSERSFALS